MDAVEEIKIRLAIEDVIGEYVQLKHAGRNWKGLSPFTNERTPSFIVSPEKQIWHDFSSGKGGDLFSFVMEAEGLDFKGALELLARKAGIDLAQYQGSRPGSSTRDKERLYELLELAAKFYQVQFSRNPEALHYVLKKRGFAKAVVLQWQIGYAPNTGRALLDFLKGKGFTDQQLRLAGVTSKSYRGGQQDMFRGRIMIPLCDPQGRVIGFTARLLNDDPSAPKYINTPQTPLYDKSRHVFGLHLAKEAIRKNGYAVLVEGNLDVIASHGVGISQVVATAGTALTAQHLKSLSHFTADIRLSFDQDRAGQQATERAIPIASQAGISLSVITIPSGKDPDELIGQDPKLWQNAIQKPRYALDWLMDYYQKQMDISSAAGKRQFSDIILPVIRDLADEVEREHYIREVAKLLDVSTGALLFKLRQNKQPQRKLKRSKVTPVISEPAITEYIKTQNHLLALVCGQPRLREYLVSLKPAMLHTTAARSVLSTMQALPAGSDTLPLSQTTDYDKMLTVIYEELYQQLEPVEQGYEAARLQARLLEQYAKLQKQRIVAALRTADGTQTQTLLQKAQAIDNLLSRVTGGASYHADR
ncbi:MAG TPA: DNA primase [Candidatus Saccharimonadales bacterium]|nr:DNA primase [Candidatus Saccharimonadales bacterium]